MSNEHLAPGANGVIKELVGDFDKYPADFTIDQYSRAMNRGYVSETGILVPEFTVVLHQSRGRIPLLVLLQDGSEAYEWSGAAFDIEGVENHPSQPLEPINCRPLNMSASVGHAILESVRCSQPLSINFEMVSHIVKVIDKMCA